MRKNIFENFVYFFVCIPIFTQNQNGNKVSFLSYISICIQIKELKLSNLFLRMKTKYLFTYFLFPPPKTHALKSNICSIEIEEAAEDAMKSENWQSKGMWQHSIQPRRECYHHCSHPKQGEIRGIKKQV